MKINRKSFWVTAFFKWSISILIGKVSFRGTTPTSAGHEEALTGLMSMRMMWIICYGIRSHQIWTQLNTYGRFWSDVLDSALHRHHQNTKWGNIFWKNGVQCQGAPKVFWCDVVAQHLNKTLYIVFSFNLSPVCIFPLLLTLAPPPWLKAYGVWWCHVLTIWQLVAIVFIESRPHTLCADIGWGLHTTAQRLMPRNIPNTAK